MTQRRFYSDWMKQYEAMTEQERWTYGVDMAPRYVHQLMEFITSDELQKRFDAAPDKTAFVQTVLGECMRLGRGCANPNAIHRELKIQFHLQ